MKPKASTKKNVVLQTPKEAKSEPKKKQAEPQKELNTSAELKQNVSSLNIFYLIKYSLTLI